MQPPLRGEYCRSDKYLDEFIKNLAYQESDDELSATIDDRSEKGYLEDAEALDWWGHCLLILPSILILLTILLILTILILLTLLTILTRLLCLELAPAGTTMTPART